MHITENNNFHMERWYNKLAIVTGADQTIGGNVATTLVNKGLIVMALAANTETIIKLRAELPTTLRHRLYPIRCDCTNLNQVEQAFAWIQNTYGCIDMLVNCAGILYGNDMNHKSCDNLKNSVNENIKSIKNCTMKAFMNMKARMSDGHIILIDSLLGEIQSKLSAYSRDVILELGELYRREFADEGVTNVKVTCITSGFCDTKNSSSRNNTINCSLQKTDELSKAVLYATSTPLTSDINELILKSI